ncbi:hypothetical protein IFM89_009510 [Coptis chinensis]|uniref:Retrotransposon gag domain-containing protein n=1 Tax=Coptis chinensis TaxID=261450 RepID=A0A835H524_9MAGN|nr:hypothetical protein IFM89_009510 [Coptis chinensis]
MDVLEDKQVKMVVYKLKGVAAAWWLSFIEQRQLVGKPKILTWNHMKRLLHAKLLPKDYRQQLFSKLQNCRQGAGTIEEYVTEFYSLIARNDVRETEEQLIYHFIGGLNRVISNSMLSSTYTMADTIQVAIKIKSSLNQLPSPQFSRHYNNYSRSNHSYDPNPYSTHSHPNTSTHFPPPTSSSHKSPQYHNPSPQMSEPLLPLPNIPHFSTPSPQPKS